MKKHITYHYVVWGNSHSLGEINTENREDDRVLKAAVRLARIIKNTISIALYERHGIAINGWSIERWEVKGQ